MRLLLIFRLIALMPSTVLWAPLGPARAQCGGLHSSNSFVTYGSIFLQYINYVLNNNRLEVGHSVNSSTKDICPVVIPIPQSFPRLLGHRLILVDTPGFDDTFVDDVEILKRIATWLAAS